MNYWKLLISLLFLSNNSFSQGINNLWLMGYQGGGGGVNFDFSGGNLVVDSFTRKMSFNATDASICDKLGNILFYTNGIWVANGTHDTMVNGSGLNPGYLSTQYNQFGFPMPQAALILPFPADSSMYYIFHEALDPFQNYTAFEFYSSLIDLNQNNGLGAVVLKNNVVFNDSLLGVEISGTRHGNGRDWWIFTHKINSDIYINLLLTNTGLIGPTIQNIGIYRHTGLQSAFSPDGLKYAHYETYDDLEIFDFNRCTGMLSNPIHVIINDSVVGGGVAFSPSGRYVYASSVKYVYQFDLQAANVGASIQTVAVWDGTYSPAPPFAATFFLMQLAPDGKIYINCGNGTLDMHVINYPDSAGLACDLQQHSVHLPAVNAYSIPNHPNYFLGRDVGSPCDSLTALNEITYGEINLSINPNPANEVFNVNYMLPYGVNAHLRIYDTLGKEVMHKMLYWYFGYLQIDSRELKEGMYFLKVEGKGVGGNSKVIVIK